MKIAGSLYVVSGLPEGFSYPFKNGETVLVFGEVENMPGHVVLATKDGECG
jgi:hypothetical protein